MKINFWKFNDKFRELASRNDILHITAVLEGIAAENVALKNELEILNRRNKFLRQKFADIEDRNRRNDLFLKVSTV